ncbi:unnamed protein product [Tuber aestivum]|uniref:Uncharacterized protein n=1 Tax=Tuber aestivum TaxID=59557 RepID=A0A292PRP9_9PEZI|nr:unnamed protein product [Tuber aestivum]
MAVVEEGAAVELLVAAGVFGPAEGFDEGEDDDVLLEEPFAVALCARNATNRFARKEIHPVRPMSFSVVLWILRKWYQFRECVQETKDAELRRQDCDRRDETVATWSRRTLQESDIDLQGNRIAQIPVRQNMVDWKRYKFGVERE